MPTLGDVHKRRSKIGLLGEEIDVDSGEWVSRKSHIGGGIDSYYEYLLKCGQLFGDRDCQSMWSSSIAAVNKYVADGAWYGEVDMDSSKLTKAEFGSLQAFFPAVLALGALALAACSKPDQAAADEAVPAVVGARTTVVVARPFTETVSMLGTVVARAGHLASLSVPTQGRVSQVLVATGQRVSAGQPLVVLDPSVFAAARQSAGTSFQQPPRNTRHFPFSGPF